jgi:hypothetical protein
MTHTVFMQKVVVCESGSFNPAGTVVDRVGWDDLPDHLLPCNGAAYPRRRFEYDFVQLMRPFTSWWRWHLLRQFRVPVHQTYIGTDFGMVTLPVNEKPTEPPSFEEFKKWCEEYPDGPITATPYQERLYRRYYEEPAVEQKDDLERTLMIPRRDPRYDKAQAKVTLWDRITGFLR